MKIRKVIIMTTGTKVFRITITRDIDSFLLR